MYKCSKITRKEFEKSLDLLAEDMKKPRYVPWYMRLSEKELIEYINLVKEVINERNRDKHIENT